MERSESTENLQARIRELEEENKTLRKTMADLRQSRTINGDVADLYRILAANIPGTAITILDRDERYLLAEGDFLVTMGYQKETMPGKKISEVISPKNYEYYQGVIRRAFAGETILVERQTLSTYWSFMKVVPLRNKEDQIFAIMFVLMDVTQLKNVQVELAKLNEELEIRIAERTDQLKEANKQLESFSYSVSHDLRAPLRSISGYAEILMEDYSKKVNDAEFDHIAGIVISNASRMSKLIDDLLEFSRSGRKEMMTTEIDMERMVKDILAELTPQESARKLEISVSTLAPAHGDPGMIRQVWVNLLSNALKYSRKKEITRIEVKSSALEGDTVYIVTDNGAGFDMQYASKLFGVFQRLHKASEFEGTGVGLALVKTIVLRHGGKIWAESDPGKETKFCFTLKEAT